MAGIRIQLDSEVWKLLCDSITVSSHWKLQAAKEQIEQQVNKALAGEVRNYSPNKSSIANRLGILDDTYANILEKKLEAGLPIPWEMLIPLMEWARINNKPELEGVCNAQYMAGLLMHGGKD